MADTVDQETRSRMMRSVRSRDTAPELVVRKFLRSAGVGYRLHIRSLPGTPDIVSSKHRSVIFVHGCFWHQHSNCVKARLPSTNCKFWEEKLRANVVRDAGNEAALRALGWTVFVLWECEIRSGAYISSLLPLFG